MIHCHACKGNDFRTRNWQNHPPSQQPGGKASQEWQQQLSIAAAKIGQLLLSHCIHDRLSINVVKYIVSLPIVILVKIVGRRSSSILRKKPTILLGWVYAWKLHFDAAPSLKTKTPYHCKGQRAFWVFETTVAGLPMHA